MALDQYGKEEVVSKEAIRDFIDSQIRQAVKKRLRRSLSYLKGLKADGEGSMHRIWLLKLDRALFLQMGLR